MLKTMKLLPMIFLPFYIQGCASGAYQVTGNQRPAIEPDQVTIFINEPSVPFEVIGVVSAKSEKGFSDEARLERAKEELKEQAAKIGANGIILDRVTEASFQSLGTGLGLALGSGGIGTSIGSGFSLPKANIAGKAIFYENHIADSEETIH